MTILAEDVMVQLVFGGRSYNTVPMSELLPNVDPAVVEDKRLKRALAHWHDLDGRRLRGLYVMRDGKKIVVGPPARYG